MDKKNIYYSICDKNGDCIPDVLSHVGFNDAWISFYHRCFNNRGKLTLREFMAKMVSDGYKEVALEVIFKAKT
jgi:hypothetical protein